MDKNPKLDRKELKRPDQFVARGQQFFQFLMARRRRFGPVLIGGVVLVAVVYLFDWWSDQRLAKAWVEYNKVAKVAGTGRLDKLKHFHAENGNARPGYFAAVALGDYYLDEARKQALKKDGNPAETGRLAVDWYGRALEFRGLISGEKQLLYLDRGAAKEVLKQLDEAFKDYQMAVDFGGEPAGLALINMGRLHEMKGEAAKAEEIYKKISTDYVNTEYAKLAKSLLRRMTSPLFQETRS